MREPGSENLYNMLIPFDYLFKKYDIRPFGVVHCGAHYGEEALEYHKHGVKRVIWIEADPESFLRLKQKTQTYPDHTCLLACISNEDHQIVDFHQASNNGQSSSILPLGTHAQEHPTVKYVGKLKMETIRVDTLLNQNAISISKGQSWFANLDVQGVELQALESMGELLFRFDHIYCEVNERELYKGCALVDEIDEYLDAFGFVRKETKMTKAGWGDALYCRFEYLS